MKILNVMKRMKESEKALEARLVAEVRKRGGVCLKLTSQFHRGMPDRLALLPYHTLVFVEMKSTGEKPRPLQEAAIAQLMSFRFSVRVVDSTESLEELLAGIDKRLEEQKAIDEELNRKRKDMTREYIRQKKSEKIEDKIRRKIQSNDEV